MSTMLQIWVMKMSNKIVNIVLWFMLAIVLFICILNFNDSDVITESVKSDSASTSATSVATSIETVVQQLDTNSTVAGSVAGSAMTQDDISLIMLGESEAWSLLTGGAYSTQPDAPFTAHATTLEKIKANMGTTIEVDVWYWEDPSNQTNLNKVSVKKKFLVNKAISPLFEHAFADAYNDPEKPVWNIADTGGGAWSCRGKSNDPSRKPSSHSYGCCVDINPSAKVDVNGTTYGNGQPMNPVPDDVFETLPESHTKYHLMHKSGAWVRHFEHYGFVWGGEFSSSYRDPMHISWIGEGSNTRENGQQNYKNFS